ncbi:MULTISPECIES: antibiotic resistance protein VanZ [unclassified Nocardiopsis]|uniref:antibiotic resistance protein VanZ n=1 Tax=unclassified Nocardiopsis TaxID=2649073 RepID=UPI000AC144E2|nr:antibiotic resistance protein VanZ [Nocardiopsis sp. TSRI0078]
MGRLFGGGQAAVETAVAAVPLLVVAGAALYLCGQYRRYGRPRGWPGVCTMAALFTGVGLAAYAVWPLPASVDGLCAGTAAPGAAGEGGGQGPGLRQTAPALVLFALVGLLARHRFRRGLPATLLAGAVLALAVTAVRATGLLGLYPCAYAEATSALVAPAAAGTLAGWLLARWVPPLWPGAPRGWPAAVPDRAVPGLARRLAGGLLDLGLWWFGAATLAALLRAYGIVGAEGRTAAMLCLAAVLVVVLPQLRRDRATPGAASVRLALAEAGYPRPAARWRVLVRTCLLQAPVAALTAAGLPWPALAVAAVHAAGALVRPDRAGVADLLCGVRVSTRSTLDGGLPSRLVRYAEPREEALAGHPAAPLPGSAPSVSATPGSPGAAP